jgi:integrase
MKLTAALVRGLRTPGRYLDGAGLALHVVSAGKRYWMHRWQRDGRERVMSLGSADVISLAEARKLHAEARALLARGLDPLTERERARAKARPVVTFAAATEAYIAAHKASWKGRGEEQWRNSLTQHAVPVFGNKPVGSVTLDDVLKALSPIWTTKTATASRVRSRVELVLDYARARGWRDVPNVATWRGNLRMLLPPVTRLRRVEHRAAMAWRQAPAFFAALHRSDDMASRALAFVILTATRSSEARGCRWSEIDLDAAVWTIPARRAKTGKEHRVPLSEPATAILSELAKLRTNDLVFFSRRQGRPVAGTTLKIALRRAGHGDVTTHGFRSTFADWAADVGHPADLVEQCLAHTVGNAVERSYRRSDVLERRRGLMDAWAAFLTREPVVVSLRAAS